MLRSLVQPAIPAVAVSGGPEETVITVAELNLRLRRAVESASFGCWVEGEVSSFKRASSGHIYFTLKDDSEEACVECVMYRFDALRALRHLGDGRRVQLFGRATVWAPRGRMQFVAQRARPAGRGAILLALEALKQKLESEGLFEPARKRSLPTDPRVVGVVTSRAGAAFHDIRSVAFRRGKVRLVLSPALVQGDGAPESLVEALETIERYPGLDVVIIGRGGGSGEDLMAFNDERVVRKIAGLRVPVVSAVGHEIDLSLADLAADVRAATPSQAAELVVPDDNGRQVALRRAFGALERALANRLLAARAVVERQRARLGDPRFVVAERAQELDELVRRLQTRSERGLRRRVLRLSALRSRLLALHPRAVVAEQKARAMLLDARLKSALESQLARGREALARDAARLNALSPLAVLGRGYAIAEGRDGRALRRASDTAPGERLRVRLAQGALDVEVQRTIESNEEEP